MSTGYFEWFHNFLLNMENVDSCELSCGDQALEVYEIARGKCYKKLLSQSVNAFSQCVVASHFWINTLVIHSFGGGEKYLRDSPNSEDGASAD